MAAATIEDIVLPPCFEIEEYADVPDARSSSLGPKLYTGRQLPEEYLGQLFMAEHGTWNRSKKAGYRVMLVARRDGKPVFYEAFAEGWPEDQSVSGRPVDLLQFGDGSMLVSDDFAGKALPHKLSTANHGKFGDL